MFISYHSVSSEALAGTIKNKLESMGYSCWYSGKDMGGGDYASGIMEALTQCRVFLLLLNKASSESAHVLNELEVVTNRLARKEEVTIIPFLVADEEISPAAQYYIGRHHWINATNPPMDKHITELANQITALLYTKEDIADMERAQKAERRTVFAKTVFCLLAAAALVFGYRSMPADYGTKSLYYLIHVLLVSVPLMQLLFENHGQAAKRGADIAVYLTIAAVLVFMVDFFNLRSWSALAKVEQMYKVVTAIKLSDFTREVIFHGGAYFLLVFYPWHRELMRSGKWKFLWTLICLLTAVWTMVISAIYALTAYQNTQGSLAATGLCLWGVATGGYIIFHWIIQRRSMRNQT